MSLLINVSGVLREHYTNNFTMEICVFYCGACHCFYCYTDAFLLCILIIYWSVIFYECICFYLTVSESDIIKLSNQSINQSINLNDPFV